MAYSMNFGVMSSNVPPRAAGGSVKFRLAVLGDFSARANTGELATGADLAKRKPLKVDIDNLDEVLGRLKPKLNLPIATDGGSVEVSIGEMDDFHPDQLYDNVEVFSGLSGLRQRLKTTSMFAKAAAEVQSWLGDKIPAAPPAKPRGTAMPSGKLSDFARLVGRPTAAEVETPVANLLKSLVGPHIVAAKDPKADVLVKAVDQAISDTMRNVLHQPDFQALEALWRSVDFLTRRIETDSNMQIVLYDITAEEVAADLSSATSLEETGLYKLLVEQPSLDAQQGALSAIIGNYQFELTPPHAELLGRIAKIAAAAQAPFIAAVSTESLKKVDPDEVHPLITESWAALRALPHSVYLGLTVPRFMLRNPYGERTDSIDRFDFEEFTPQSGVRGMLWGNSAVLAGLLLAQTCEKQGMKKMNLGSILSVGDMPYYFYEDADGDQIALPCTERLVNVQTAERVTTQRFMPVLAIKGRNEVRLGGFQSLAAKPLAGPWAPVEIAADGTTTEAPKPAPAPEKPVEVPAPAEAPAAEAPPAQAPEAAAAEADAELDALLASLSSEAPAAPPTEGSDELDPDLAALLADL
jgi:type VI secretion system protein ImpC